MTKFTPFDWGNRFYFYYELLSIFRLLSEYLYLLVFVIYCREDVCVSAQQSPVEQLWGLLMREGADLHA